jgi:predicted transcriptional regulator
MDLKSIFIIVPHTLSFIEIISTMRAHIQLGVNKLRNRRSKLEIYLDVLKVIKGGTKKPTRIMYGANLSWKLLQGILNNMVSQNLILEVDSSNYRDKRTSKYYQITNKGDSVIRYFDRAKDLIEVNVPRFDPLQIARGR